MSAALAPFEVDLGHLSKDERAMLPFDRHRERELDFLTVALYLARGHRLRAGRIAPGTPDFRAEEYAREMALTTAQMHYENLRDRGHILPPEIVVMARAEGLM